MRKILLILTIAFQSLNIGAQNLIPNGDFETGTRSGWNSWGNMVQDSIVYEGSWAGLIKPEVAGSFLQIITLTSGMSYDISFTASFPDGIEGTSGIDMQMQEDHPDKAVFGGTAKITSADWTTETARVTVPEGVTSVRVSLYRPAGPACYIDNVSVVEVVGETPTPELFLSDDGELLEDFEDGEQITLSMNLDSFTDPINTENWTVTNLPVGVDVASISRVNDTAVVITLGGNTTGDYDEDITNMTVSIAAAEFTNYEFDNSVETGVTFKATLEGEMQLVWEEDFNGFDQGTHLTDSIFKADYDFYTQGAPDSVKVLDGYVVMYTSAADENNNWFQKWIELNPGSSYVFTADLKTPDGNKTNVVVIDADPVTSKGSFVQSTDWTESLARFTVADDKDTVKLAVYRWGAGKETHIDNMKLYLITEPGIEVSDDGEILEGAEDGEVITVKLNYDTFVATPLIINWVAENLPEGVSLGSLNRVDDTTIEITLSGNASVGYDADLIISITGSRDEFVTSNKSLSASGVNFTVIDESPALSISDDGEILEGAEDGEVITVSLVYDSFAASLTEANWTLTNLPEGVSMGSLTRVDDTKVEITLAGNATTDYDQDIVDLTVTVTAAELQISETDLSANTGVTLTATVEPAEITISDDGEILEGAEDGEVISVMLVEDSFVESLTLENWIISNLPAGVTAGSVNRVDDTSAEIVLSGNASEDYDADIVNVSVTVAAAELSLSETDVTASEGVTFTAEIETSTESLRNEGLSLYPNPFSSRIMVASSSPVESIQVFDMLGKKIQETIKVKRFKVELATGSWEPGIYFIQVRNENGENNVVRMVK
ncbi:MAG: carbohydrate binding domain-containing protein [Bacteroidales bacterium]|nr:carbohydrate binding domain-containing protein [Bacteroidales bacterium]